VVLMLVIGLSGLAVGLQLVVSMPAAIGVAIGASFAVYGLVTAAAGFGLLRWRSRVAWGSAIAAIVAGLLLLAGLEVVVRGTDVVLGSGVLIWGIALICLLAPGTRAVIEAGRS
jgi:hypothetical protein